MMKSKMANLLNKIAISSKTLLNQTNFDTFSSDKIIDQNMSNLFKIWENFVNFTCGFHDITIVDSQFLKDIAESFSTSYQTDTNNYIFKLDIFILFLFLANNIEK